MKKVLTLFIVTILLITLTSCGYYSRYTKFYKKDVLKSLELNGLPKPDYKYVHHTTFSRDIYGVITEEEFHSYAKEVLEFLCERFDYVGTSEKEAVKNAAENYYRYLPVEKNLENFLISTKEYDDDYLEYRFTYFNLDQLVISDHTQNAIILTYHKESKEVPGENSLTSNFKIDLPGGTVLNDQYYIAYDTRRHVSSENADLYNKCHKFYFPIENKKEYDLYILAPSASCVSDIEKFAKEYGYVNNSFSSVFLLEYENEYLYSTVLKTKDKNSENIEINFIAYKKGVFNLENLKFNELNDELFFKVCTSLICFEYLTKDIKIFGYQYSKYQTLENEDQIAMISAFIVEKVGIAEDGEEIFDRYVIKYKINRNTLEIIDQEKVMLDDMNQEIKQ